MKKGQKGFTFLELLLALTISALIAGATLGSIFQVMKNTQRNNNQLTATREVQNAGFWIGKDAQLAQIVTVNMTTPYFLQLDWTEGFSGDIYQVVYTFEDIPDKETKKLLRNLSVNGGANATILVASYIDPDIALTSGNYTGNTLNLMLTATVGDDATEKIETRLYQLSPRPGDG